MTSQDEVTPDPTVPAVRQGRRLLVQCPHCGGVHVHGAMGSDRLGSGDGHRRADCARGGYYIREAPAQGARAA